MSEEVTHPTHGALRKKMAAPLMTAVKYDLTHFIKVETKCQHMLGEYLFGVMYQNP